MPHHKSAKKRVKTNEVRRLRNVQRRTKMRHAIRDLRTALADPSVSAEDRQKRLVEVGSMLDRMSQLGLVHENKAARLKRRLTAKATA